MQAAAYLRARKLLGSNPDSLIARALGVVEALVALALLLTAALFVWLLSSRGEVHVTQHGAGDSVQHHQFTDSGLTPLITANLQARSPIHRTAARALDRLTVVLPTLRNNVGALATLMVIGLVLILLVAAMRQARRRAVARVVTGLTTQLRNQIHRQMYRLGQSSLPTEGVGPVINIWTREVNDVRDALVADFDVFPRMLVLAVGLLALALLTSPILTVFLASLGLLVWITARVLNRDARQAHDAALRDASLQVCLLHEDLGLLRTVRVYGVEAYDRQRFDEHLERLREAEARRFVTGGSPSTTTALLYGAAATASLGLLGYNVLVTDQISIATMLILLASLAGLVGPIVEWDRMRKSIRLADRSATEVFEFLERSPELHQNVAAEFLAPAKNQIALENVTLESRSGRTLLDRVSVEIPALSRTAVMGMDDDSRLAIACLIPRLIDPQAGRVRVDGRDLREMTLESVRAQVGTVLQADMVFTDSVLVNIGLGDPRNNLQRVIEAAKIAHAHHFIQELPHGYDTVVGPLGHYLKPDEQFRIALARAFLHDPSILIVEEPASAIDPEIRLLLDDTLARLAVDRTLIVLPHRLSSVMACDNVLLLDNGRVVEIDAPARLQTDNKLFRHLLYTEFNEYATGEIEAGQVPA